MDCASKFIFQNFSKLSRSVYANKFYTQLRIFMSKCKMRCYSFCLCFFSTNQSFQQIIIKNHKINASNFYTNVLFQKSSLTIFYHICNFPKLQTLTLLVLLEKSKNANRFHRIVSFKYHKTQFSAQRNPKQSPCFDYYQLNLLKFAQFCIFCSTSKVWAALASAHVRINQKVTFEITKTAIIIALEMFEKCMWWMFFNAIFW